MNTCEKGVIKGEFIEDELARIIKFTPSISYCPIFGIGFDKEMTKGWHLNSKDGKLPTGARLFQWAKDGNVPPFLTPK